MSCLHVGHTLPNWEKDDVIEIIDTAFDRTLYTTLNKDALTRTPICTLGFRNGDKEVAWARHNSGLMFSLEYFGDLDDVRTIMRCDDLVRLSPGLPDEVRLAAIGLLEDLEHTLDA